MKTRNTFTRIIALTLAIIAIWSMCGVMSVHAADSRRLWDVNAQIEESCPIPSTDLNREIAKIPLFNQIFYTDPYGHYGTIASSGCGIVCLSMVSTYLTNRIYAPEDLAEYFSDYNTENGSKWILFQDSAEVLGIDLIESDQRYGQWYDWNVVYEALQNGQPVVCLQGAGLFTGSGHFIVLTGINEDGKIMVNDPNGHNWTKNRVMREGFANGFTETQIRENAIAYWIYGPKTPYVNHLSTQTTGLQNMMMQ